MASPKSKHLSKLPALNINKSEPKSPGKNPSPLKNNAKRQNSIPAPRINDETSSPELEHNPQYKDLKLAPIHQKSKNQEIFKSANLAEKTQSPSFEENENEANQNQLKPKESQKHSQSPNKNRPPRFLPKDTTKEPKKPQLHSAIKALEKSLGEILESKFSKIQSDCLNERFQKLAPFRRRRSRYLSDIIKD